MRSLIPALVVLPLLAGCPKSQSPGSIDTPILKKRNNPFEDTQDLDDTVSKDVDINGDGVVDQRLWHNASGTLVRREVDLNLDGHMDVFTRFGADGKLEREEMDGDFDGRIDWVDYYKAGKRTKSAADTDYDGWPDSFNTYSNARLTRRERDTDGDGVVDFSERYDANGEIIPDSSLLEGASQATPAASTPSSDAGTEPPPTPASPEDAP